MVLERHPPLELQAAEPYVKTVASCSDVMNSILKQAEQSTDKVQSAGEPSGPETTFSVPTIRVERTRRFGRVLSPRELWRYREVAMQIAARDITVRYRQTVLGALWAILQPVATMVVFSIFFGHLAHVPSEGHAYPVFSLAALVPWTFFANVLLLGSDSLVANYMLVSKTYFPRIFIPAGVLVAGLVDICIAIVILVVVTVIYGVPLSPRLLALPLFIAMAAAAALGVSSALSAMNVRYRDVRYIVPFATQLWLFLTPVVYPITLLGSPWRTLAALNPMAGVVEGFRWAVLGSERAPWTLVGVSAGSAAILLIAGLAYFDRVERSFADVL
jgi:lipopolysaccharide transport system permease protein